MDFGYILWIGTLASIGAILDQCLAFPNPQPPPQRKSDKAVIFPQTNVTEHHSLPVFPEPVIEFVGRTRLLAPEVDKYGHPLCASKPDDTFCESVDNYPETEIRGTIRYSKDEFRDLFGANMAVIARKMFPLDVSEESICSQQSRMFYPKAAMNENDQWAYVVNDVDYVQAVMAEMCDKEDKPCNYLDGALPAGMSSRCKQKFAYKRLLALHPNNKKTYTDAFRFPSCCVCYVKHLSVMSRMENLYKRQDGRTIIENTKIQNE